MSKKNEADVSQDFISTTTIAKRCDLSSETIRREIEAGHLKAQRFGRYYMVRPADYEEWKARYFKPHRAS